MSVVGEPRAARASLSFGPGQRSLVMVGDRALHQYWHFLKPSFGSVLLPPHWRADDTGVLWSWDELPATEPLGSDELSDLRARLARCVRASADAAADKPPPHAQVHAAAAAMVKNLVAAHDAVFAGYVTRTPRGLYLHSWGLPQALAVTYPYEEGAETAPAESDASDSATTHLERTRARRPARIVPIAVGGLVLLSAAAGAWWVLRDDVAPTARVPSFGHGNSPAPFPKAHGTGTSDAPAPTARVVDAVPTGAATNRLRGDAKLPILLPSEPEAVRTRDVAPPAPSSGLPGSMLAAGSPTSGTGNSSNAPSGGAMPSLDAGARPGVVAPTIAPGSSASGAASTVSGPGANSDPSSAEAALAGVADVASPGAPASPASKPTPVNQAPTTRDVSSPDRPTPARFPPPTSPAPAAAPATTAPRPGEPAETLPPVPGVLATDVPRATQPPVYDVARDTSSLTQSAAAKSANPEQSRASTPPASPESTAVPAASPTADAPLGDSPPVPDGDLPAGVRPTRPVSSTQPSPGGALTPRARLAVGVWETRLMRDAVLPTRPRRAGESEPLDELRREALAARSRERPTDLRPDNARVGLAFRFPPSRPVRWVSSTGLAAGDVDAPAGPGSAELGWSDRSRPSAARYTLIDDDGAAVARVDFDDNGRAAVAVGDGVRVWPWVALVTPPSSDATVARARPTLAWRVLRGGEVSPAWREDGRWRDGRGWRLDLVDADGITAVVALALVDDVSGWGLTTQLELTALR